MPYSPWASLHSSLPPQHAPAVRRAQGLPISVRVQRLLPRSRRSERHVVRALQSDDPAFARCMRSHGEPVIPGSG